MMFIKASPNSHGWVNPKDVEELWLDHFNYFYREYDEFVFPVTVSLLSIELVWIAECVLFRIDTPGRVW